MPKPILVASGIAGGGTQDLYASSSTQNHRLGTRAFLDDGRVFYYGRAPTGTAATVGEIHVARERVANHENLAVAAGGGALGQNIVSSITVGATALTANQYADGHLAVTDGTGEGHLYKIRNHAAFAASATDVSVTLYDNIAVGLDATSTVSFVYNLWDQPQQGNTDQADVLVGVPVFTIVAGEYGWFQTWGPASVLCDEAVATVGQAITIGTGVAGAVEEDDTATTVSQEPLVGFNLTPLVDTEHQVVMLTIMP